MAKKCWGTFGEENKLKTLPPHPGISNKETVSSVHTIVEDLSLVNKFFMIYPRMWCYLSSKQSMFTISRDGMRFEEMIIEW